MNSALTTFRREMEEGEELELHSSEVAALMNLVATGKKFCSVVYML